MYALMRTDYKPFSKISEFDSLVAISDSREKLELRSKGLRDEYSKDELWSQPLPDFWIVSEADGDFEVL